MQIQKIDVRSKIARELCVNLLIHRQFDNPTPASLIITKDRIQTENANKPKTIGYIDLSNYTPYPKNPKIAAVFKEIGLADELGSGFKKIIKYTKIYSNSKPIFKDGDVFKAIIPLINNQNSNEANNINIDYKELLYQFIINHNGVTRKEINEYMKRFYDDINDNKKIDNKIRRLIDILKVENRIVNKGTKKCPYWYKNGIKME